MQKTHKVTLKMKNEVPKSEEYRRKTLTLSLESGKIRGAVSILF